MRNSWEWAFLEVRRHVELKTKRFTVGLLLEAIQVAAAASVEEEFAAVVAWRVEVLQVCARRRL